ncbi:DUF2252 domain-containing protein [Sphingomonas paeninsulae]|uniref:DUF2252 domain-containing protein n=1 Tax=Sphingomonas paeninsulae TaxID=2319844 RepID=A0A494TEW1_SPHPE|nr:DUF2252 family protein [Sphingomonas paeninsulae]AYJ85844.1 DUF2252 domain-containing protein [Sphingomonas paeninsulae]
MASSARKKLTDSKVRSSETAFDFTEPQRQKLLNHTRELKMARSTHAYVRGNTRKFYEWLADSPSAKNLPDGPPVWICGDCHVGNLGPIASADGSIDVQIRDLDQTTIGNPVHDLIRLGLSLATAARGSDLPGVTTAHMIEAMVDGYELALAEPEVENAAKEPNVVRAVRRRAIGRRWRQLARERIEDVEPVIPLSKKYWALSNDERIALTELFAQAPVQETILRLNARADDDKVRLVDAAYWMKGCSSLGKLRYAALVSIGGSRKSPAQHALIDLKQAVEPFAPTSPDADVPVDHGERVVAGAKALSPNLGDRMLACHVLGKPMVLRELMPQDLKLEFEQFSSSQATVSARYLAHVVGRAHARQMNAAQRREWIILLRARHGGGIDAPPWLWLSVVDLLASHEGGYLEHCRRYALRPVP